MGYDSNTCFLRGFVLAEYRVEVGCNISPTNTCLNGCSYRLITGLARKGSSYDVEAFDELDSDLLVEDIYSTLFTLSLPTQVTMALAVSTFASAATTSFWVVRSFKTRNPSCLLRGLELSSLPQNNLLLFRLKHWCLRLQAPTRSYPSL